MKLKLRFVYLVFFLLFGLGMIQLRSAEAKFWMTDNDS